MFPEGSQVCIGSIRKMDFGQIWYGPTNGSWDELCVPGVECTTSTFLVWSAHLLLSWCGAHTFCFPGAERTPSAFLNTVFGAMRGWLALG